MRLGVDREDAHQAALFAWARLAVRQYPDLERLYAVPNGGLRDKRVAARLVGTGVRRGVPDIVLPVARWGFHSLYIELKRLGPSKLSGEQADWIEWLNAHGHKAVVCKGWEIARDTIVEYLGVIE
jgi:hypothetical protein